MFKARGAQRGGRNGEVLVSPTLPRRAKTGASMMRQEPVCEIGSGPCWSKAWWRGVHHPPTPLSSIASGY